MANVVCFVDDDPAELLRFENAMKSLADHQFTVVTASTYQECIDKLGKNLKPSLWVLDLFFPQPGTVNTPQQIDEMAKRYAALEQHTRDFRAFLAGIGQGPEGGLDLLATCLRNHNVPVVMLTRKGTLDDAIRCIDRGAIAVLKKPMPASLAGDPTEIASRLDQAMLDSAHYLRDKFRGALRTTTFWHKHEKLILPLAGYALGAILNHFMRWATWDEYMTYVIGGALLIGASWLIYKYYEHRRHLASLDSGITPPGTLPPVSVRPVSRA